VVVPVDEVLDDEFFDGVEDELGSAGIDLTWIRLPELRTKEGDGDAMLTGDATPVDSEPFLCSP